MGLGSMMAGGNPADERQKDDFYPTPPEVTQGLLNEFDFGPGLVMEPCAGNYAMSSVLEQNGYNVVSSDLVPRDPRVAEQNFFDIKGSLACGIITNPPFNLAAKIITHALDVLKVDYLALVLKATFWHAKTRNALFQKHPPSHICALTWRPDFMNKGAPTMDCIWSVWTKDRTGITRYVTMNKP